MEKQTYSIAGKTVTAEFDIEDFRHDAPAAFGAIQVNATLVISGKAFPASMQADDEGVLSLCGETGSATETAAVLGALDPDEDRALKLFAPILAGAQHKYNVYTSILNDVDEPVEGVELRCGCALNGIYFECKGDGYLTILEAPGYQQAPPCCYAIDEVTAAALREIEESTSADHERTSQVADLADGIPMVRAAKAQTQGMSR